MQRRTFLTASGGGALAIWLAPLGGCAATAEAAYDAGSYVVGEEHLVFRPDGGAYALDVREHRVRRLDADLSTTHAFASLGDDPGELNHPVDGAVGPGGRLFVLDRGNGRVQVFEADGRPHTILAAHADGEGALRMPRDLLIHANRLHVCDTLGHRVVIFDLDGLLVGSLGEGGDGQGTLNGPRAVAADRAGRLHVVDGGDASVQVFAADGSAGPRYGGHGSEPGRMLSPASISADGQGRLFIADPVADRIHVFDEGGAFLGRFAPVDAAGQPVVPARVSHMPDGQLYVWTGEHTSPRAVLG